MSDVNQFVGWVFKSKEMSLDEHTGKIRDAFYHKFDPGGYGPPMTKAEPSLYIREVYPDYVIASRASDNFKVAYSMVDGVITFSETMIPVEQIWREKV